MQTLTKSCSVAMHMQMEIELPQNVQSKQLGNTKIRHMQILRLRWGFATPLSIINRTRRKKVSKYVEDSDTIFDK